MPDQITVSEFVAETNEDYKSPTASIFTTRMSHCRNTVAALEEVGDHAAAFIFTTKTKYRISVFLYSHLVDYRLKISDLISKYSPPEQLPVIQSRQDAHSNFGGAAEIHS